jgi:hypothetical protein
MNNDVNIFRSSSNVFLPLLFIYLKYSAETWFRFFYCDFLKSFFSILLHKVIFIEIQIIFCFLFELFLIHDKFVVVKFI